VTSCAAVSFSCRITERISVAVSSVDLYLKISDSNLVLVIGYSERVVGCSQSFHANAD